jgi:RNA ligase partner protein
MVRKFVIDTSLFVNPHARKAFGKDPKSAARAFIKKIKGVDAEFYIPPSIFREMKNFIGDAADELELVVKKRAPDLYSTYLPAAVFYNFIDDVRGRVNKGLRLAEEFAKDNHPDNDAKLVKLRDKYRDAMRTGIVDSKEDLELVLLAKELEATLVSADEGAISFANDIGCEWLNATKMSSLLKNTGKKKGKKK